MTRSRRILVIAGPNGAGKTTFALEFLPNNVYRDLVDEWKLYDNAGNTPVLLAEGGRQ